MAGKKRRRRAGPDVRTQPGSSRTRRALLAVAVLVIAAAAVAWATSSLARRAELSSTLARIPDPPATESMSDALRQVVQRSDARLREAIAEGRPDEDIGRAAGELGRIYHANTLTARAAQAYDLAMELDARNATWPHLDAFLLQERGEVDSVTRLLRRTVELDPGYSPAWLKLGDNLFKQGLPEEARTAYERRLSLSPGDPWAHLGLARIARAAGDWSGAQSHLESAIATDDGFGPAHRMLAAVHAHFGRPDERQVALARADDASRFAPAPDPRVDALLEESYDVDALLFNVTRYAYVGDGSIAQRLFNRARQLDPENPDVYVTFGRHARNPEEAVGAFEMAVALDPQHAEAHALLGEVLLLSGQPAEAEALLRRAIELGSPMPAVYKNLGLSLAGAGKFDEAIANIEQSLVLGPEAVGAHYSLAFVLRAAGRLEEAARQYRRVLELRPSHPQARADLAALTAAGVR